MVEQSSQRKRSIETGSWSLKLGFPDFHSRRQSSVTYKHPTGGRDIVDKDTKREREKESFTELRTKP